MGTLFRSEYLGPNPSYPFPINNVTGENEIKVENRNLFDKTKGKPGYRVISTTGEISQYAGSNPNISCSDYINIENMTSIYINGNSTINDKVSYRLAFYDENKTYISGVAAAFNKVLPNNAVSVPSNAKYVIFNYMTTDIDNIILSEGTTATPYIPHEEQTVTFPLSEGQYMAEGDYLADDGIHHVRGKVSLKDLIWTFKNTNSETGISTFSASLIGRKYASTLNSLCTHFQYLGTVTGVSEMYSTGKGEGFAYYYNPNYAYDTFMYLNIKISTVAELQTWLNTNNPALEYELATETIEPYTQAQQEAWNKIKELHTYLDYTQISQTNDGLPFILKVSVN